MASSISTIIGADLKSVCTYMQDSVKAELVAFEQGGLRGDYSAGLEAVYQLIVRTFVKEPAEIAKGTYNILGASIENYRMKSDLNELRRLMKVAFGYEHGVSLCEDCTVAQVEKMVTAELNLVLSFEGLKAARYLEKEFGTPYLYCVPYGYQGTLDWLGEISAIIDKDISSELVDEIQENIKDIRTYKMYSRVIRTKKPTAFIYSDYDRVVGLTKMLKEFGITAEHKICKHSLKAVKEVSDGVVYMPNESDRIALCEELSDTFVLADDVTKTLIDSTNTMLRVSTPLLRESQIATHLPFMGLRGTDYIREFVDYYYSSLM